MASVLTEWSQKRALGTGTQGVGLDVVRVPSGLRTSGSAGRNEPHHPKLLDNQQHEFDLGDAD